MAYKTKFGGYQADSDLSASDWTQRWATGTTATVLGIGYEFISSDVNPTQSLIQDILGGVPEAGTYIIGLTGQSDDAPGVQGVSIDGQLGTELFELIDGDNFITFWLVNPSSFADGDINIRLNSTHRGITTSVWRVFGAVTTFGDSAFGLTSGATDSLALSIRNVILGLAHSGTTEIVGNSGSTRIMLHMNGTDASTTFTDEAVGAGAHTWTAAGNAQIDTAQSKFGGASGLFDGTGDWITTPDSSDFALGSSDFTIDCWFNANAAGNLRLCGQSEVTITTASSFIIDKSAANFMSATVWVGAAAIVVTGTTAFSNVLNPGWHHLALVRTGDILKLFIDGIQEGGDVALVGAINNSADALAVGSRRDAGLNPWNGWIDEFRLTVGFAKWASNFTPPTSAYTINSGAGTDSDIHFWANLTERLDEFISGSAYWSVADLLLSTDDTSRELVSQASENPTTQTWAALAFYTPVTYFPSGQGVRFEQQVQNRHFWSWDTVPQIDDVEILALVRPTVQSNNYATGVILRAGGDSGTEEGYAFLLTQSTPGAQDTLSLERYIAGSFALLDDVAFSWSLNTNYWMRFRARGTTLQARIWAEGLTEPTTWNIETTDSSHTTGRVGMFVVYTASAIEVGYFEAKELFTEWPEDTIPNNWTVGIQGGPQSNKIAFTPDVGPTIDRRRASAISRSYQVECPGLTQTEYLAFVEFYHTTLKEGTLPFTAMDPFTGLEKTFKFGSESPAYTESIQRSPGPDYTNGIYQVAFTVVRLD
jgi:hypothetical protein